MVRHIGGDEIDDQQRLAVGRHLKGDFHRPEGVFHGGGPVIFFELGIDALNSEIQRVEGPGADLAAKNPRGQWKHMR